MIRNSCILDGSELKQKYVFHNFPIKMGNSENNDIFSDLIYAVSKNGLVQLSLLIEPTILYNEYHNPGSVGVLWERHHKQFSDFIKSGGESTYLEIGGSTGNLAKYFSVDNWKIIDPNKTSNYPNKIDGFFELYDFAEDKYDTVVHSHTLEHVYDPKLFLSKIRSILTDNGSMYISIPNMYHWLKNNYYNTVFFEHTYYLDFNVLENLLHLTGFVIENSIIGEHSIFVKCKKSDPLCGIKDFSYVETLFDSYLQQLREEIFSIKTLVKHRNVFLFGANIFSQMILNLGIDKTQVINILDNDSTKHGNKLYGSNISIQCPEIIKNLKCPIIVVKAGIYTNEIKSQLLSLNPTSIIV